MWKSAFLMTEDQTKQFFELLKNDREELISFIQNLNIPIYNLVKEPYGLNDKVLELEKYTIFYAYVGVRSE